MHHDVDKNWKLLRLLFEKGWNLTEKSTGNGMVKLQLAQQENNHIKGFYIRQVGNSKCLNFMLYVNIQ